jgi:hypothetical protein
MLNQEYKNIWFSRDELGINKQKPGTMDHHIISQIPFMCGIVQVMLFAFSQVFFT